MVLKKAQRSQTKKKSDERSKARLFGSFCLRLLAGFFAPFFLAHLRVLHQKIKRFTIAQPVGDATYASFLCQGSMHLLQRLSRRSSNKVYFLFYLFICNFDLLFICEQFE